MPPTLILLLNPNSSPAMTNGMLHALSHHMPPIPTLSLGTYTAPAPSPSSIDDAASIALSHTTVLADASLPALAAAHDGILVACYSEHALVGALAERFPECAVTGILEASVLAALGLGGAWGIVTTGAFWEENLSMGVRRYLLGGGDGGAGAGAGDKFVGVFTTGLNAGDFHSGEFTKEEIGQRLRDATRRLLTARERVGTVVMGCAGMVGMEEIVREMARKMYGREEGDRVYVVDPVRAGVVMLEATIRNRRMFRGQ